jgi:hypothetical protein
MKTLASHSRPCLIFQHQRDELNKSMYKVKHENFGLSQSPLLDIATSKRRVSVKNRDGLGTGE